MIAVLTCIGTQHDPWLIALAASICAIGSFAAMRLLTHAFTEKGVVKHAWAFLAALVTGTTTWTTHFISILAYSAKATVHYDATLTILSLLVAVLGVVIALAVATLKSNRFFPAIGGGLLGLAVSAMHYVGMKAYELEALLIWKPGFLVMSLLLATGFGAMSVAAAQPEVACRIGPRAAPLLLMAAILALHFTGMSAIEVVPLAPIDVGSGETTALAVATALAAGLIIVVGSLAYVIEMRNRNEASLRIAQIAQFDTLTGFASRTALEAELVERVRKAKPDNCFAVIAFELAGLNEIQQQFGSQYVDMVILALAHRLEEARTPDVFLARTSSTQICGVGEVVDIDDTRHRARKLHAALCQKLLLGGVDIPLDVRIGVATFPQDAEDPDTLIQKAQLALARAMTDPLRPIAIHDESADALVHRRLVLLNSLHGALDRGEFALFFQRQVSIADRSTIGFEALLRWVHPELGLVSPAEFIPLAEKTGRILAIGEWALRRACLDAAEWSQECRIAVNVSPLQLRQRDLPERIQEALLNSGLAPGRLEIEVTESLLIHDRPRALHVLRRIRALGVRLVLDDFGTGYSSMDVLRQIQFDKVKLDKSFVDDIERNPQARAILHAMLALGEELEIAILAEGVESEQQLAILRKLGCSEVQGYLTGRPAPASAAWDGDCQRLSA